MNCCAAPGSADAKKTAPNTMRLSTQSLSRANINRFEILVNRQHHREPDHRLGGCQHDHENCENLSVVLAAAVERERQIVDVGGIENQFDAHQDSDRVAPGQNCEEPQRKNHQAQDQKVIQRDSTAHPDSPLPYSFASWREITIAPINAASRTSDATSN